MNENQQTLLANDELVILNVNEILNDSPDLKSSMKEDGYYLQEEICTEFKEIKDEDKTIGFITLIKTSQQERAINNYYVKKEYQDRGYLADEIIDRYNQGFRVVILNPTRKEIDELLKKNLAQKITKTLVITAVNLDVTPDKIQETKYTTGVYLNGDLMISSTLYDLKQCSVVYLDDISSNRFAKSIYFSKVNRNDLKEYNVLKNRKNLEKTINHVKKTFEKKAPEIEEKLIRLQNNLYAKSYTLEEITAQIERDVNNDIITKSRAELIEKQLRKELEEGKIIDKSLYTRLTYLERNDENPPESLVDSQRKCYCKSCSKNIATSQPYCYNCGHVINSDEYDKLLEYESNDIIKEIRTEKYSLHDDFDFESQEYKEEVKSLKMIEATYLLYNDYSLNEVVAHIQYDTPDMDIEDILIKEEFICEKYDKKQVQKFLKQYSTENLKFFAEMYDLKHSGSNSTLIKRIQKFYKNQIKQRGFYITTYGIDLVNDNSGVLNLYQLINKYVYSEFIEIMEGLETKDNFQGLDIFYNRHLEHAWKRKHFEYYTYTLDKLSELYHAQNRYEEAADLEVKNFLIHLNPYMMNPKLIEVYQMENVLTDTVKRLRFFVKIEGIKLDDKIEDNWQKLEFDDNTVFVPLEDCKEIIDESISFVLEEEIREYLVKTQQKYFSKYY